MHLCHRVRNQTEAATVRLNIYPSCYFLLLHARYVNVITRSRKVMRLNVNLNKVELNFAHGQWNDRIIEFATYLLQMNISTFPFYSESPQNNYSCLTVVGTASALKPCRTPHTRHLSAVPPVSQIRNVGTNAGRKQHRRLSD